MPLPGRIAARAIVATLLGSLALAACNDSPAGPGAPAALIVEGGGGSIAVGDSVSLSARAIDEGGHALPRAAIVWRSLSPDVATVDSAGVVRGVEAGVAAVVASVGALADTVSFRVEVLPRHLELVAGIWNGDTVSVAGNSVTMRVVVRDGRGRVLASPLHATFAVDDTTLATRPSYTPSFRSASSYLLAAGRVTLTARLGELTAQRTISVILSSIAIRDFGLTQVTIGDQHACGLAAAGRARCWGWNNLGQLGRVTASTSLSAAIGDVQDAPPFTQVAAGGSSGCGITALHRLWCWGTSGIPSRAARATPVLHGTDVAQVGFGPAEASISLSHYQQACARGTSGEVWCWGASATGWDTVPARVPTAFRFTTIAVGRFGDVCGLLASGRVACRWGSADAQEVAGAYPALVSITQGGNGGCGLTADGATWCWYSNGLAAQAAWSTRFIRLGLGYDFGCGLDADGVIWCWGQHPSYWASTEFYRPRPVRITRDERFRDLLVGPSGVCGVREDGDLGCEGFYANPVTP